MDACELIIKELIKSKAENSVDLSFIKKKIAKKTATLCPSNSNLLKVYHELVKAKRIKISKIIERLLITRPVRSLSGIINVSVLTKPYPCPGKCVFCPTQKGVPKSYLDNEPAVMRAIENKYHPYKQVQNRLRALEVNGHPIDKIEIRMIGGTWSYYPKTYREWFIKECFRACNEFKGKKTEQSINEAQKRNEKAKCRVVGLSVETRPDFINNSEIKHLRKIGATMVELGVQTIYNKVLILNKREKSIDHTIRATRLLKDAGFKVLYQMMPNLPGSSIKMDKEIFKQLFKNSDFKPDLLKIYPTAIIKGTVLYKWWKDKKYKPYSKKQLIRLIKSIKKIIPYYVRIQRITRDIPSKSIVAGPAKISNLRQIVSAQMEKEGWSCKCIRCRQAKEYSKEELFLLREDYEASKGKEIFLSFEDKERKHLYGMLRLRITSDKKAIIRQVHTYGLLLPVLEKNTFNSPQHKGIGKKLIKEAEQIAKKEFEVKKISVISGIGVREYFRKLGYRLRDTYMVKNL